MLNYSPTVHIVDDDDAVRNSLSMSLTVEGFNVKEFPSATSFLEQYRNQPGCLILDMQMPSMSGLDLQTILKEKQIDIPLIFITGHGDVSSSVQAMKSGATDFIEKPFSKKNIISSIRNALKIDYEQQARKQSKQQVQERYALLTSREKEVMMLLTQDLAKLTNQQVAEKLGISKRTIEVHRSSIMAKMLAHTRAELVEFAKACKMTRNK